MASATPVMFAVASSRRRFRTPKHLQLLDEYLYRLASPHGDIKRLMVFMPPRHGKSLLCSQYFPAWFIGRYRQRVILTSYEATFAESWGRLARDVLAEWGPEIFGISVSRTISAGNHWELEGADGQRGVMYTAGAGGAITGKGADLLIIDDPIKNAEEANSPTYREKVWQWYTSTAYTRLEPDGRVLIIQTRWHDDDLSGRILKEVSEQQAQFDDTEPWYVLSLPALAEHDEHHDITGDTPFERHEGDALWPERFDEKRLNAIKQDIGGMMFAALYQQAPVIEGGVIFKREWLNARYRELPLLPHERVERAPSLPGLPSTKGESKERLSEVVLAVDGAWKTGVANDYSVIAVWGRTATHYYLLDIWRDKVELPSLLRAIDDMAMTWRPHAIIIEDEASGIAAIQALRDASRLPVVPFQPTGSKQARAAGVSPLFEANRVLLPDAAPWLSAWIEEHVRFPKAPHDDQVDTSSMALERLRGPGRRGSAWNL